MGLKTGMLESPLVVRVFDDTTSGIVQSRRELDHFLTGITRRHPVPVECAPLYRTGDYVFHGNTLLWEYPRETPDGDQLDVVEVIDSMAPWRGVEHVIANAEAKAARWDGCQCRVERTAGSGPRLSVSPAMIRPPMTGSAQPGEVGSAVTNGRPQARTIPPSHPGTRRRWWADHTT